MAAGYVSVRDRAEREAGLHRVQEVNISRRAYRARWSLEEVFRDYRAKEERRDALARLVARLEQFDAVLVHGAERVRDTGLKVACEEHDVRMIDTEAEG